MIIIGAIAQASSSKFHGMYERNDGAIFIMVIGAIVFIVAFFGCCGAIKENRCLLLTFAVMMIVILILSIAAIITAYVYRSKTESWLRKLMEEQLESYGDDDKFKTQKLAKTFWDAVQRDNLCCGIENATDWQNNKALNATHSVPDSCCVTEASHCGNNYFSSSNATIYDKSCFGIMRDDFKKKMLIVGAIACCVAILQVIGIILAFSLAHAIHKGYNVVS
jgi:CD63 antigen